MPWHDPYLAIERFSARHPHNGASRRAVQGSKIESADDGHGESGCLTSYSIRREVFPLICRVFVSLVIRGRGRAVAAKER
jgi:hypothetical protein